MNPKPNQQKDVAKMAKSLKVPPAKAANILKAALAHGAKRKR